MLGFLLFYDNACLMHTVIMWFDGHGFAFVITSDNCVFGSV